MRSDGGPRPPRGVDSNDPNQGPDASQTLPEDRPTQQTANPPQSSTDEEPVKIYLHQLNTFPASAGEVIQLCEAIRRLETKFKEGGGHEHRRFLAALAVLSAEFLCTGCEFIPPGNLRNLVSSSKVLIDFFLDGLAQGYGSLPQGFMTKTFLTPLVGFAVGNSCLEKKDQSDLIEILKEAPTPPYIILNTTELTPTFDEGFETLTGSNEYLLPSRTRKDSGPHVDMSRPQTDLTPMLMSQLVTPIERDVNYTDPTGNAANESTTNNEQGTKSKLLRTTFATKNVQYLQSKNTADLLIHLCASMPHLSSYISQWNDAISGEGTLFPSSHAEAQNHKLTFGELVTEIITAWRALTLPVLEPLTTNRISKLCQIVMGSLLAAVSVSTTQSILSLSTNLNNSGSSITSGGQQANSPLARLVNSSREEELDFFAVEIVEKSLELFNATLALMRESTRAGGHILQNMTAMGAWILASGLHVQITNTSQVAERKDGGIKAPKDTLSPSSNVTRSQSPSSTSPRTNLIKAQQGFGVLSVALGSQALTLVSTLLEDLSSEASLEVQQTQNKIEPANFDLFNQFSATQRVAMIFSSVSFIQLLFNMALISYRKACNIKCMLTRLSQASKKESFEASSAADGPITSAMDQIDDENSSDVSSGEGNKSNMNTFVDEDDEDSEPLLKRLFEESNSAVDSSVNNDDRTENASREGNEIQDPNAMMLVPEKGDPAGFISLASHIFIFLNKNMITSESAYIKSYIQSHLSEQQMSVLAAITKDLDYETSQSAGMELHLLSLYSEFSNSLATFTHNLLAYGFLTEKLQNSLLQHLYVSPWQIADRDWPLKVYPRTLSILAQVLLIRQTQEEKGLTAKLQAGNLYVLIWERVLSTLTKYILVPSSESDQADLNIEHVQLLLFFFHALTLMQKKQVLLLTASSLVKASKVVDRFDPLKTSQMFHIARLVMLFEYMMRNLYEPPKELMEQVQHNIFKRFQNRSVLNVTPKYFPFDGIGNTCPQTGSDTNQTSKFAAKSQPRYYNIFRAGNSQSSMDIPKLDGLASSFLLSTHDILQYNQIYDALLVLLQIIHQVELKQKEVEKDESFATIQYCFSLVWRILQALPPSVEYLESLISTPQPSQSITMSPCHLLHSVMLCSRALQRAQGNSIKDALVKQGQTVAKAENLLKSVTVTVSRLSHDVKMFKEFLKILENKDFLSSLNKPRNTSSRDFIDFVLLDALMSKVQISLESSLNDGGPSLRIKDSSQIVDEDEDMQTASIDDDDESFISDPEALSEIICATHELVPIVAQLIDRLLGCAKSLIVESAFSKSPPNDMTHKALVQCLSVAGTKCPKLKEFSQAVRENFLSSFQCVLKEWNETSLVSFPSVTSWRKTHYEPYLNAMIMTHISGLSKVKANLNNKISLKHCLFTASRLASDLCFSNTASGINESRIQADLMKAIFPLLMDACSENLSDMISIAMNPVITNEDKYHSMTCRYTIGKVFSVLLIPGKIQREYLSEKLMLQVVNLIGIMLEDSVGRSALEDFFIDSPEHDLVQLLMTVTETSVSAEYTKKVLQVFIRLIEVAEKNPRERAILKLCDSLARLAKIPSSQLEEWLRKLVLGGTKSEETEKFKYNVVFLKSLAHFIVSSQIPIYEDISQAMLKSLIPMASSALTAPNENSNFVELLAVMTSLASAGSASGHVKLFRASNEWLEICKAYLVQKNVIEKLEIGNFSGKHMSMVENACHILNYLSDILSSIQLSLESEQDPQSGGFRPVSPVDGDTFPDAESDWIDDMQDEDDSADEDSDDDSLCNKLCTYTQTQKEFINQHWYHCHTCKMVEGIGVCTVCAKVCHADHDVTYAKYGSFFCDCGAKEDGSCAALVKRAPPPPQYPDEVRDIKRGYYGASDLTLSGSRYRAPSPTRENTKDSQDKNNSEVELKKRALAEKLSCYKEVLLETFQHASVALDVLHLMYSLLPVIETNSEKYTSVGMIAKLKEALGLLHRGQKIFEMTDNLMTPTLGSQEGAFENVRMNYSGDQGQTIRQLMNTHLIRRVVMCCLASNASIGGKQRQHLAVAHEKGKITVLQLSALLKQADSSQKKLTLTRLTSAPIPFTVLSVVSNPMNEDYLAVTGLKDCHVLTFSNSGSVSDHLVLHPQLDSNNFIIKVIWLPGSQTQLALVTADFIKIYDLGKDVLSPQYFFFIPSGKVRDCTIAFMSDGKYYVIIMSSAGHIYHQALNEESLAKHGPFYVTNTLDVQSKDLSETGAGEQIGGGGVSIFYYHSLQMLFFSYIQGKSFMAPLTSMTDELTNVLKLEIKASGPSSKTSFQQPPLCQWAEIPNHPGLITAFIQTTNNPVVIMIKPEVVCVQEIKIGSKSKIIDIVAIRHSSSNQDQKTTLILLCEDGSLKIYMASEENTNYWLSHKITPLSSHLQIKPPRKKKAQKQLRVCGSLSFPIDFFESCSPLTDIEFGGSDVLQVYNVQQIKHRLQTMGLYIANTKPSGFSLEITNNDTSHVIVGVRVMLGSKDITRVPSYIEVFGRSFSVNLTRQRWFDIPLAREESYQADKKLTITFGPSLDESHVSMVDNVTVYGKSKESFGWPDDHEEATSSSAGLPALMDGDNNSRIVPMTSVERLVLSSLEILNGYFHLTSFATIEDLTSLKKTALELMSEVVTIPASKSIESLTKSVLASLFASKHSYYSHKDRVILEHAMNELKNKQPSATIDGGVETFLRVIISARAVANSRPQNLLKFTDSISEDKLQGRNEFMKRLSSWFWELLSARPVNLHVGVLGQPGLTHIEAVVQALIDIFHAFTIADVDCVPFVAQLYAEFLMSDNIQVSFAAKQAMVRALRPRIKKIKAIPMQPAETAAKGMETKKAGFVSDSQQRSESNENNEEISMQEDNEPEQNDQDDENQLNIGPGGINLGGVAGNLDAILPLAGGAANLPNILESLAGDVDDEAMVELAIALSLQDQQGDEGLQGLHQGLEQLVNLGPDLQGLPGLQGLAGILGGAIGNQPPVNRQRQQQTAQRGQGGGGAAPQERSHYSDTTASAPATDDEGDDEDEVDDEDDDEEVGTDGRVMDDPNVIEPDQVSEEAGGSESGESGFINIDSMGADAHASGRSSAYEADDGGSIAKHNSVEDSKDRPKEEEKFGCDEIDLMNAKLHSLRLLILEQFLSVIPNLCEIGGVRSIPLMQVILTLTSDLDSSNDHDSKALGNLTSTLMNELFCGKNDQDICERSNLSEMQLVILRLFSVLMSRAKSSTGGAKKTDFVSHRTVSALVSVNSTEFCLKVLSKLLPFWKSKGVEETSVRVGSNLLKVQPLCSPPDMSPFFLKQYVKGHAHDVFEAFPQLLTEMTLRLPYQIKKLCENISDSSLNVDFGEEWFTVLCEYMMTHQTPYVRRQVRKLLLYICGSKEKYRQLRDLHSLSFNMKNVRKIIMGNEGEKKRSLDEELQMMMSFPYDTLLQLIEHLKACLDISTSRTRNWQKFCLQDESVLVFLFQISCGLDEGVSPIILQLLQGALCTSLAGTGGATGAGVGNVTANTSGSAASSSRPIKFGSSRSTSALARSNKGEKSKHSDAHETNQEALNTKLIEQVNTTVSKQMLMKFIERFLLESNSTSVRWQGHALIVTLQKNSPPQYQEELLDILWQLWHELPKHGRKAAQFVDLLGYFSMKTGVKVTDYINEAVEILKSQNRVLDNHPNANIYGSLSNYVDFNGYFLESDPCLVCNNPEVPFTSLKLSTLKVDTKYTTTTQIVKLSGSHSINKIALRITDVKRQKMVRTINIYYNNRSVQAVVELKNRPIMWHKAKKVSLSAAQTDVKVEFPLPIVACNLMIEYADFYENIQASSETLQCPRCSASVPANPGVCGNCGENVFQCHKCRSINYDEKDPFLCNACGFCKYAKFEYTLTCRPCCGVDPIENEEDRKKAVANINAQLDTADKVYKQLIANKPYLEASILKITEGSFFAEPQGSGSSGGLGTYVNANIQQLAQRYCGDCRNLFEELSKITQKVTATRKELLAYDNTKRNTSTPSTLIKSTSKDASAFGSNGLPMTMTGNSGKCYGCAAASVEHCLTLLRALAANPRSRHLLFEKGLIPELLEHNLRRGSGAIRNEVRKLISFLTKDNFEATEHLNTLLCDKISLALQGQTTYPDLIESVRHEMALLAYTVLREDSCWEQRLKCVFRLFLLSTQEVKPSPTVMACVTLPCLRILQGLMKPNIKVRGGKDESSDQKDEQFLIEYYRDLAIDVHQWLKGDPEHTFEKWCERAPRPSAGDPMKKERKSEVRKLFLSQKYFNRWYEKTFRKVNYPLDVLEQSWLKEVLFSKTSKTARQVACSMIDTFCNTHHRKKDMIDLLTKFLDDLGDAGEAAADFCSLYQRLISTDHWQYYLAIRGSLGHIAELITEEIEKLSQLERTTLSSDLAQGFTLKTLVEILGNFLSDEKIKSTYKSRLVSNVLHGYLSLRRLVVQRTKLIDQTQEKLLELLEDMTTGTEEETKAFMAICVQTIKRYPLDDQLTPVFIFERLCNIIYPEEADTGEFFMTLEKDPQQEDFLQGRMLGNPYSSADPDLGPLMREIKNKICRDCELVALLEDDNGMELLVNNKIISLDLPVKDVYMKIWLPEAHEGEPMRIIYRMRGLLGDATEEFIETLESKDNDDQDEEEVYRLANVMAECGGVEVMLTRMENVVNPRASQELLSVLLKLFGLCIKVRKNRVSLLDPRLKTISVLLQCLHLCLESDEHRHGSPSSGPSIPQQILCTMETLLEEAASVNVNSISNYVEISSAGISMKDIEILLDHAVHLKSGTDLHQVLMRVLPFLTYGNSDKMTLVVQHFDDVLQFEEFDDDHGSEKAAKMQAFVVMCNGIERKEIGSTMKKQMLELGIVDKCINYLKQHAPKITSVLMRTEDQSWKEFVARPSLRYILQIMSGLAKDHTPTQMLIADHCLSVLHQMEQVSSDEHIGSLAEAVLEAFHGCPEAEAKVKQIRDQTKAEKKKLAMAMRAKQLEAFGLKANEQGQVKAGSSLLQKFVGIAEESGLCCNICREGYKFQPTKVLAIYTYTIPCPVEDFEPTNRKTMGYSTVSHFNLVHVDCHSAAVRQMRGRDEWESAMLQNANTKCNGLLPLWGPSVPESGFASCLARHNTYLSEATGHRDIGYVSTIHDLKLLLLRFASDRSFSEESGGGGPQSNMHLAPYILHAALYVINTTRSVAREDKNLTLFLDQPKEKWIESCYAPDGPYYYAVMAMLLFSPAKWKQNRVKILQRLLLAAHMRKVSTRPPKTLQDRTVKDYNTYKTAILFFALVDQFYESIFCNVTSSMSGASADADWSNQLAEWIRHNDDELLKATSKLLSNFQQDLLPATSVDEIIDVCGLLGDIPSPASFLLEIFALVP